MDGGIKQTLSSSLRVLSIARILFDVGDQTGIEDALAIVRGIKAGIEIQIGSCPNHVRALFTSAGNEADRVGPT
jgi:hypothetical protein